MKSTGIRDLFSFSMWVNFLSRVISHKLRNCLLVVFTAFQLTTFKYNNVSVYYCSGQTFLVRPLKKISRFIICIHTDFAQCIDFLIS